MHRALIATLFACAACGGKNTIPATAEIKAAATSAQQSLDDTSTSTHATIGLQAVTQGIGDAALSGTVSGVDLSRLPDPSGLASAAMAPPSNTTTQGLRAGSSGRSVSGTPTGCLVSDGTGTPTLIEDGTLGCNAVDHLEVSYDNGDQVNITYAGTATTFDLRVEVVAGRWQGTSLHYSGTYDAATGSSARVAVSGALEFASASSPVVIDADFQVSYHLSVFDSATGQGVTVAVNGTAADHLALVRATAGLDLHRPDQYQRADHADHRRLDGQRGDRPAQDRWRHHRSRGALRRAEPARLGGQQQQLGQRQLHCGR